MTSRIRSLIAAIALLTAALMAAPPAAHAGDTADAANCIDRFEIQMPFHNRRMSVVEREWKVTGRVIKANRHGERIAKKYAYCRKPGDSVILFWTRANTGRYLLYAGVALIHNG